MLMLQWLLEVRPQGIDAGSTEGGGADSHGKRTQALDGQGWPLAGGAEETRLDCAYRTRFLSVDRESSARVLLRVVCTGLKRACESDLTQPHMSVVYIAERFLMTECTVSLSVRVRFCALFSFSGVLNCKHKKVGSRKRPE